MDNNLGMENCLIIVKSTSEYKKKSTLIFFKKHILSQFVLFFFIFSFVLGVKYDPWQMLCDFPMQNIDDNVDECRIIIHLCAGTKSLQRWMCPKDCMCSCMKMNIYFYTTSSAGMLYVSSLTVQDRNVRICRRTCWMPR